MKTLHRRNILAAALMAASIGIASPAFAQSTPRIVVGNAPGGSTDIVARMLAPIFSRALGKNYIVENRIGASGNIAADAVAKSAPNGDSILLVFSSHATVGLMSQKLPFDPIKDFASIGSIGTTSYLLVAPPTTTAKTFSEFARSVKPGTPLTAGSPGAGSVHHLVLERLAKSQPLTIVQYKGSAPAQADVMAGHLNFTLVSPALGGAQIKGGKLKPLAVTSKTRMSEFPDVPTAKESGANELDGFNVWLALLVPAATPRDTVMQLNRVLNDAIKKPEVREKLAGLGMEPTGGTPEALDKLMQEEATMWRPIIRDLKITLD